MIENLNQLKRALRPGIRLQIVDHRRTECINQLREVTWITSNGFCTKVLNQPDSFRQRRKSCRGR